MTWFGTRLFRSLRVKRFRDMARYDSVARAALAWELLLSSKDALERGRPDLALGSAEEAVTINRAGVLGEGSRSSNIALAESLQMLTLVLCELDRFAEARPVGEESVALVEDLRTEQSGDQKVEMMRRAGRDLLIAFAAHDAVKGEDAAQAGGDPPEWP